MRDIKMSIAYGWKVLSETWWWITLAGLYLLIGGALYSLAGLTAARWTNNPDILAKLNYKAFILSTRIPPSIKFFASYAAAMLIVFATIYFFAGFVPSKRAKNKNHNRVMAETAVIFFVLNLAFALLSYFAIASSSTQPNPFSFSTMLSQYFGGIANNVFGFVFFALIAIISYVYEKFTLKNVFQVTAIYFIMESLQVITSNLLANRFFNAASATFPVYRILIASLIYFALIVFTIFIIAETVLQDSLSEGTRKGLHLLRVRGNLVWTYLAVYIAVYITTYAFSYLIFLTSRVARVAPSQFFIYVIPTVSIIMLALGTVFLVVTTFQLARIFENRDYEEAEIPQEDAADSTSADPVS